MPTPNKINQLAVLIENEISRLLAILEGQEDGCKYALSLHSQINAHRLVLGLIDDLQD